MSEKFMKRSLLSTTVIAGLAFAAPAFAQEIPEGAAPAPNCVPGTAGCVDPNAAPPVIESAPVDQTPATQEFPGDSPAPVPAEDPATIIVTGTRIVSPNITSLAPVQVIGETEIDQAGAINVQEILLENPAFGTPGLSRTNSAFLTSGAGTAIVDLRDLGSDRTLVLINNRRVVAGLPGSATVDLNVIPTQFIDRIDVLTGGASSLYGSDAVAGVVNFIYKRNFSGILAEAQYGITSRGDAAEYQLSLTGGGNFLDDRGNLMVHIGYSKEDPLLSRERKNTRVDDLDYFFVYYDPDDFGRPYEPFFSSFPPQGRFNAGGTNFSFDPVTGELFPCFRGNSPPTCTGVDGGTAVAPQGFNRQFFRTLAVPVERYLFATRGHFEITDNINAFMEGTYAKTRSASEIEPFPLDSAQIAPRIPIETFVNGVAVRNPFVPDAIFNAATDVDGDGLRDITFARRLSEVGSRNLTVDRDFFRFVVGLEGTLLDDRFSWDISYNYGTTSEDQSSNGQVNVNSFFQALQGIPDVNDLDEDGDTTDVICASALARAQGCQPINIYGMNSISPEALAYVSAGGQHTFRITQKVWSGNISGSLVDLPAGPLGIALGAEYRQEASEEDNDALTNAGLNAGNALPDTAGEFDVKEVFAELNIPILADTPFFEQLNVRMAGRVSDYSTVGTVTTYNIGADWAPIDDLRFRGTYARSVRAPNIGELFTGPSQTFPPGISDPCVGIGPTGGGALGDRCRADPGVAANIAANGVFTINQADRQGISGFNSGNPNLSEEKSRSITAGFVFTPTSTFDFLRSLVLSVDYYNIKVDDAIVAPGRNLTLDQCYNVGDPFFCNLITRFPQATGSSSAGALQFINAPAINGAKLKVEGVDTVLQYRFGLDRFMSGLKANARISWTHILDAYSQTLPTVDPDPFDGELGTSKDRVNGTLAFSTGKWGLAFTGNYLSGAEIDDQFHEAVGLEPGTLKVGDEFYLDAQLNFQPTRQYEFFLGVDNLLDNDAPNILSGIPGNVTGADTAADVYDIFGRRFYAGARLRF